MENQHEVQMIDHDVVKSFFNNMAPSANIKDAEPKDDEMMHDEESEQISDNDEFSNEANLDSS